MATKTLTITEDAYNLLKSKKLEGESFSEEIMRKMSEKKEKKSIWDYFGILSEEDGQAIMDDYWERKKRNLYLGKRRLQRLHDSA